jgi:hypothetical protein
LPENESAAQDSDTPGATWAGSTNDLAAESHGWLDKILQWVPRILSSKPHVLILVALGVYLIVMPLFGFAVSSNAELIGGNYTNVTSDIGACIAAGGTLHLVSQSRKRRKMEEERLQLARETHRLLHHVYGDAAEELGHVAVDGARAVGATAARRGAATEPQTGAS